MKLTAKTVAELGKTTFVGTVNITRFFDHSDRVAMYSLYAGLLHESSIHIR
jgi:hypothetical protein